MTNTQNPDPDIFYSLDANNVMVAVGLGWDEFATANGAPQLRSSSLIGKPVLNYFSDAATRRLYARLFDRARTSGNKISFDYRCDSPTLRRFMRLTIKPVKELVTVRCETLRKETRQASHFEWAGHQRAARSGAQGNQMVLPVCSLCSKVQVISGDWHEIESAVKHMSLDMDPRVPLLAPSLCPDCENVAH